MATMREQMTESLERQWTEIYRQCTTAMIAEGGTEEQVAALEPFTKMVTMALAGQVCDAYQDACEVSAELLDIVIRNYQKELSPRLTGILTTTAKAIRDLPNE